MKRFCLAAALVLSPIAALANPHIADIVNTHILPRFEALAGSSQALSQAAQADCDPASDALRAAYGTAFDAWVSASHLRFGPTEADDRAFALAFWPDSRGATPRALASLIADEDPIGFDAMAYADMSIAARGFYAMEFLLYDEALMQAGAAEYRCALVQTVAADIAHSSAAILEDWQHGYADILQSPGPDAIYRSDAEVLQEMLRALGTGLQFTQDSRLGRPLGTFEHPRPRRAEARRSGRSARHVRLSLVALQDLAAKLAAPYGDLADIFAHQFGVAIDRLDRLDDPVFVSVVDPQARLKVEMVSQAVGALRATAQAELGPALGVAAGFNALDGD